MKIDFKEAAKKENAHLGLVIAIDTLCLAAIILCIPVICVLVYFIDYVK